MKTFLIVLGALFSCLAHGKDRAPSWETAIERAVPAIVAIRVVGTRSFDTESAGSSVGTGFVVDKKRGIILTNRHMVHAGPVVAEAVFNNHEEVALQALYRDPVHDFGFYRFNPDDVRFLTLEELPLNPEGARVGLDIRVIGNDSGEKISILDGTLARLDRGAPNYGGNTYNDFNTFYLQAASNTSGGSSGSPVINIYGEAVGLNAGGKTRAASSFYLPLGRVTRALELLQRGSSVPRGTLQTVFKHKPFDELRRLGLTEELEATLRDADGAGVGALVVDETVPDGPGWERLRSGDILIRLNKQLVQRFEPLEQILDDAVGAEVLVEIQRGGETLEFDLVAGDLHAISPDEYVEFGQGVFHELSYQQARNHSVPVKGVYVANTGFAFRRSGIPRRSVLTHVNGKAIESLDDFFEVLKGLPHAKRVRVKYHRIADPTHGQVGVLVVDRLWFPLRRCTRNDKTGQWPCQDAKEAPEAERAEAQTALSVPGLKGPSKVLGDSLVMVEFDIPFPTSGLKDFNFKGVGIVIDADKGLVLVDRDTIPVNLGELSITFGGQARVDGEVVYVHPVHNFAILKYDPNALVDTTVRSVRFAKKEVKKGAKVWQVGMNSANQHIQFKTRVARRKPLYMAKARQPKYRDMNVEGIDLVDYLPSVGGVLSNRRGEVSALWASFYDPREDERDFYGLPVSFITSVAQALKSGQAPKYTALGAEVWPISLADGRELGLPEVWAQRLFEQDPERRKVLRVLEVWGGSPAKETLQEGDLLVAVDGKPVTRMADIEELAGRQQVEVTRIRDGQEETALLPLTSLSGSGVEDIISWAGLVVHSPHHEVSAQTGREARGVYTAWMWYGSPAQRYGIYATRRIVEIDGQPVPDMDAFFAIIQKQQHGQSVRLSLESLDQKIRVKTLKIDLHYWAPFRLQWKNGQWNRLESANE